MICNTCERKIDTIVGMSTHLRRKHGLPWKQKNWRNGEGEVTPTASGNPMRHLETALSEIDNRLAAIHAEQQRYSNLVAEADSLKYARDRIAELLRPLVHEETIQTVSRMAHA